MAYTQATAADLKALLTKFATVADATVEIWLERARRSVDDSWAEDDRAHGEILLAGHYLTLEGLGTGAEAELAKAGLSGMQTVRSGKLSFTKGGAMADAAAGSLESTSYGQQYLALLRQNRGGARVTPSGTIPDDQLYRGPFYFGGSSN